MQFISRPSNTAALFELFPTFPAEQGTGKCSGSFPEAASTTWQHSPAPTGKEDGRVHYSARPPAISQAAFGKQEGGRLGCCFDVAASRNEPGAKLSGIQEWHPAALGAGGAACALTS